MAGDVFGVAWLFGLTVVDVGVVA